MKADEVKTKPREFYTTFKPFLDTKAQGTDSSVLNLEINGTVVKDQTVVANQFATYFASVAKAIGDAQLLSSTEDQLMDHASVRVIQQWKKIVNGPQFEFRQLNIADVSKTLWELNPRKSTGYDQIPTRILKIAHKELAPSQQVY